MLIDDKLKFADKYTAYGKINIEYDADGLKHIDKILGVNKLSYRNAFDITKSDKERYFPEEDGLVVLIYMRVKTFKKAKSRWDDDEITEESIVSWAPTLSEAIDILYEFLMVKGYTEKDNHYVSLE